jgi:hypothetical protein
VAQRRPEPDNQRSNHLDDHICSTLNSQLPTAKEL